MTDSPKITAGEGHPARDGPGNKRLGRYEWVLATAVLTCVVLCFWLLRLNAGRFLNHQLFDLYVGYVPMMKYQFASLSAGELPLWNPYQVLGKPFLAYPLGWFYPPSWLCFLLPIMRVALQVLTALHLVAAGLFTFWFCRTMRLAFLPSLAAGFCFSFGGVVWEYATWTPVHGGAIVWLPLGFVCVARLFRDESYGWALGLAATCAVQLLAGFPQFSLYMYYALGGYMLLLGVAKFREKRQWKTTARLVGLCTGGLLLGALTASVELVPLKELAGESLRLDLGEAYTQGQSLGASNTIDYVSMMLVPERVVPHHLRRLPLPWLITWPCLVAGLAGLLHRKRGESAFFGAMVVVSVLLSMGPGTWLHDLYTRLPTGNIFTYPRRILLLYSFGVAVLAGMGLDLLTVGPNGEGSERKWRTPLRVGAVAVYAIVLALCVSLIPADVLRDRLWGTVVCAAIAVAVCMKLLGHRRVPWRLLSVAAAVLLMWQASTWFQHRLFSLRLDETVYEERAGAFEYLKQHQELSRAIIVTGRRWPRDFKLGGLRKVYIFGDYDALESQRVSRYIAYLNAGKVAPLRMIQRPQPVPGKSALKLLNLVGVKHVMVPTSEDRSLSNAWEKLAAGGEGNDALALKLAFEDAGASIYENRNAMPRAYFVPDVQLVTDEEEMLQTLASPEFDARRYALIEDRLLLESHSESGAETQTGEQQGFVGVEQYGSHEVRLRVEAPTAGFVVLTDLFYPGWRAEVDGTRAEIHRANYLFRMVQVGKGEHEVRFMYSGGTFYKGLALSLFAVVIMAAVAVLGARAHRKKR